MSLLHGYWIELDLAVIIQEISLGGFSVESSKPFEVGSDQTFLFTASDGRETMVACTCRHARLSFAKGPAVCVAGFEFLPQPSENLQIIVDTVRMLGPKFAQGG